LKDWLRKFAVACGTISLLGWNAAAQPAATRAMPAIALLDTADLSQWQTWCKEVGWQTLAPSVAANAAADARIQALAAAIREAVKNGSVDPARIYLAGRGGETAAAFFAISRLPDLWAAAVMVGGSPQPAIDSDRFFAANFTNVPVLWISPTADDQPLAKKLQAAGIPLEWRLREQIQMSAVFEWLGNRSRDEYPPAIDCETDSPTFASCYWIRMTKFDAGERNDVLPSSRMEPAPSGALDLGGFGYQADDPGPGLLVTFLPEKYSGPLKMGDRIVALDGKELANARQYRELMAQVKEDRQAAVMVQRGKQRVRLETSVVLPRRAPIVTARVQAKYAREEKEIQILSRTVTEMLVTIRAEWVPAVLNWNGVALEKVEAAGCRVLRIEKALESVKPCP
jgi:membrane-associated protease RseP (regulator of RpoE activity)